MIESHSGALQKFQNSVGLKFQIYNSLFLSLPFYGVDKTGILLSLFSNECEEGYALGKSPTQIIEGFFEAHPGRGKDDFLFRFVQYAERQVVLFDALEDASFVELHDTQGAGTLKQLETSVEQENKVAEFVGRLNDFSVRLVLTAHPTQFYPGAVLGIINDLVEAIGDNDITLINTYLQQLGRTPFFKKQKPSPFDEATSLIWYLENVFYHAIGSIASDLKNKFPQEELDLSKLVKMGFWSGGDRDGNPFVTTETTRKVAAALKRSVLKCYYKDVRDLKRRLTFTGVDVMLTELESRLYQNAFQSEFDDLTSGEIIERLDKIRAGIIENHNGLFVHLVDNLIEKTRTFGLHFAALDIRQDSGVHAQVLNEIFNRHSPAENYAALSDSEKIEFILHTETAVEPEFFAAELTKDTLRNIRAVKEIQKNNGEQACERYIISHCESALNIIEVYGLFALGGWNADDLTIDIVPLFETITDLRNAPQIMRELYEIPKYRRHLSHRNDVQTIMLGFSDGTKDGGYLMANWSIYQAKDQLTKLAREYKINVIFFDGRGGPPARGGGKTHKFYSSMGENIAHQAIELTVQGQTVSSNFGTVASAQYNIEQLVHAGIHTHLFAAQSETFTETEEMLMQNLAEESFAAYDELKNHPRFLDYLSDVSPLKFYAETNIGSRPAKRGAGVMTFEDLRAIPFVGAWSQLKQNVPGFYGVGTALRALEANADEIKTLYQSNLFFKTLMDNCEMAMQKSDFNLTAFLAEHEIYGEIWRKIHDEYELCKKHLAEISGRKDLMADYPIEQQSVRTRERIVLPLTTIQQYALTAIRETTDENLRGVYEKLIIRCSFGIINAGRNSA
ncbi:MAG: phosphoenolpyruvate carboxylase [Pyrinomonadaceae bacterium]|nr:phosphoenolpyruvate carboxylase [Pyrinomonadaceae bacterium]